MELAKRSEVPVELTWDLTAIYPDKAALQAAMEKIQTLADEIEQEFKGKLTDAETVVRCLGKYRALMEVCVLAGSYCNLAASV